MKLSDEQRRAKLQEIAQRVVERLEEEWPAEDAHLNELEDLAQRVGRELMREVTQEMIQERASRRPGNQTDCDCGGRAVYRGDQSLTVVTSHGRMAMRRAYYYCAACKQGHCPLDREWDLGVAHTTPTVQNWVAAMAAQMSYQQVSPLLARLGVPVVLDLKSVEWIAQGIGEAVAQAPPQLSQPATAATRPLAVAVDEAMLPTWEGYKAARCAVIYEPDWDAGRTVAAQAGLHKEYLGTLGSRDELLEAACRRVKERCATPATPVAALGDGAPWIWAGYARHLPQRVEILDLYHVVEHLSRVSEARYGEGTAQGVAWLRRLKHKLVEAGPQPVLRELRAWQPTSAEAQEVKRQELGYLERNRARLDYPRYLKEGWPIGSGAVEGTCKHLVTSRFKGAGMRWKAATAEPLLQLRAALLSQPHLDLRPYASYQTTHHRLN